MAVTVRRGKEFYARQYARAIELHQNGASVAAIAQQVHVSYSCAYHWVHELRKPDAGRVSEFESFLQANGPSAAIEVRERFPKHNELFLIASRRGRPLKRVALRRAYGEYGVWYYIIGQEAQLDERVAELFSKAKELKSRIKAALK